MQAKQHKYATAPRRSAGRVIGLTLLLLIVAGAAGGLWYWNTHKKTIIKSKLEDAIREKTLGLYKINYDDLTLDEIAGFLSIKNMTLTYDPAMYSTIKKLGTAPSSLISIRIPEITVTGVKTPRALIDDEIVGKKLLIRNPTIDIAYTYSGKDSARNVPTKDVVRQLLGNLDMISIDTVLVTGAQVSTTNGKTGKKLVQMQDISAKLFDIKIDSTSREQPGGLFFAKHAEFACSRIAWASSNKLYAYTIDNINLSSSNHEAHVKSFRMNPTMDEDPFVRALPAQDDRFDLALNNITLHDADLAALFNEDVLAEQMQIGSASFKIYRDLSIPRDNKNRVGSYPQQVMQTISTKFNIKKLDIVNAFVEYKERNQTTRESGKVQFYNVNARFTNFTNDKKAIASDNVLRADITSSFLNKTPLKTSWTFYLRDPKGKFGVSGSLGAINATELNALTIPMGPARMKEGRINGLEFDLNGDDNGADGKIKFLYDGLKVEMLEKDHGSTELDNKSLLSFLANMVIKDSNPKGNEEPQVIALHYDRDTNHSLFYLCWKTIFKAVKETTGVKK
jgi:hypothetical protein